MVSKEETNEEQKSQKKRLPCNIIFCPYCGTAVDHKLLLINQNSNCIECKQDMNKILVFDRAKRQFKRYCNECSYVNPPGVEYCIKCSSNDFSEKNKNIVSKFFHEKRKNLIIYVFSFLISLGLSLWFIFGIASEFIIVKDIVAVIIVLSFTLIFSWFLFAIIWSFTRRK